MNTVLFCWAHEYKGKSDVETYCFAYVRKKNTGDCLFNGTYYYGDRCKLKSYRRGLRTTAITRLVRKPILTFTKTRLEQTNDKEYFKNGKTTGTLANFFREQVKSNLVKLKTKKSGRMIGMFQLGTDQNLIKLSDQHKYYQIIPKVNALSKMTIKVDHSLYDVETILKDNSLRLRCGLSAKVKYKDRPRTLVEYDSQIEYIKNSSNTHHIAVISYDKWHNKTSNNSPTFVNFRYPTVCVAYHLADYYDDKLNYHKIVQDKVIKNPIYVSSPVMSNMNIKEVRGYIERKINHIFDNTDRIQYYDESYIYYFMRKISETITALYSLW